MEMVGFNARAAVSIGANLELPAYSSFVELTFSFNIERPGYITAIPGVFLAVPVIPTKAFSKLRYERRMKRLGLLR